MSNKSQAVPIEMPSETAKKYKFTAPIFGGPVFDFPQYGFFKLNLAELSESMAERLLAKGWSGIARNEPQATRTASFPPAKADKE